MRLSLATGALVILATLGAGAQEAQPKLDPPRPTLTVRMQGATMAEALQQIADLSGISIQYADNLPAPLTTDLINLSFVNAPAQDVLTFVVRIARLSFTVVDAKTIRIEPLRTP